MPHPAPLVPAHGSPSPAPPPRRRPLLVWTTAVALACSVVAACGASGPAAGPSRTSTGVEPTTTTTADPLATTTDRATSTTGTSTTRPTTTTTRPAPSSDEQDYLDAFAGDILSGEGRELFTADQAQCLARRFLDEIGLDRLQAAGIAPEEFNIDGALGQQLGVDATEADQLYDEIGACGVDLKEALLSSIASGGEDVTPEERACLDAAITDDDIRRSFIADFTGEDLPDDPFDRLEQCFADRAVPGD